MDDIVKYLQTRIEQVRQGRAQAAEQERAYRAKAESEGRKVKEQDMILNHLRQWLAEATQHGKPASGTPSGEPSPSEKRVPIRKIVGECLKDLDVFTPSQLANAVQERERDAKQSSIYAELNHRNKVGDVIQIDRGLYRSNLKLNGKVDSELPGGIVTAPEGGKANEPPTGFGQVEK